MAKIIGLPKLSPTMEEGTLLSWAKKEGDAIGIDDLLAEVETDKATMEFRSFDKGVLLKILAKEGTALKPDQPVAIIGNAGEDISALLKQAGGDTAAPAPAAKSSSNGANGNGQHAPPASAPAASKPALATASGAALATVQTTQSGGRVFASPMVRKVARERDIPLNALQGTGPKGRIVLRDLDGAPSKPGAAKAPAFSVAQMAASLEDRTVPLSSMRKTIARRLTESKQTVPHFYLTIDTNVDAIWKAREQINASLKDSGEKVSINDLVIKAVALALRKVPEANASFLGDSIRYHGRVDISVAVAVPDGLVTPVVRNADQKGVLAIAREVKELATKAKNKKLSLEEMQNGTFSISNLGMYGIEEFGAVINPPEGAILAVGTVREEPIVVNGELKAGRKMKLTLSCDHRVIDGAVGATFLKALRQNIESPLAMLL